MFVARYTPSTSASPPVLCMQWGEAVTDVEVVHIRGGVPTVLRSYEAASSFELSRQWPGFHCASNDLRLYLKLTVHPMGWEVLEALVLFHASELDPLRPAVADGIVELATDWGHVTPTHHWGTIRHRDGRVVAVEHEHTLDTALEEPDLPPRTGLVATTISGGRAVCCAYERQGSVLCVRSSDPPRAVLVEGLDVGQRSVATRTLTIDLALGVVREE